MENNKRITEFKIGSDPEVFLVEKDSRAVISAIPFIPGDKDNPYPIPGLPEGCMIQVDNIMIEFCLPATKDSAEFHSNFRKCLRYAEGIVPATLETSVKSSAMVLDGQLLDPKAQMFGCDPDFNVWDEGAQNEPIDSKTNLRTCGGHIHIGYNDPDQETSMNIIKALDIFLGVPSVLLDSDRERKKMYGKAGAFRFKSYGVEYRSLSNFWLVDEDITKLIFKSVDKAIDFVNQGKVDKLTDEESMEIQTCINSGDEQLAYKLINRFGIREILNKAAMYID